MVSLTKNLYDNLNNKRKSDVSKHSSNSFRDHFSVGTFLDPLHSDKHITQINTQECLS